MTGGGGQARGHCAARNQNMARHGKLVTDFVHLTLAVWVPKPPGHLLAKELQTSKHGITQDRYSSVTVDAPRDAEKQN